MMGPDYLFIDGRYLRSLVDRTFNDLFGQCLEISYREVRGAATAEKAFYYDCLDDIRKTNEPEIDFERRLKKQTAELNAIRSLPGFHVRLGTLSGEGKRLRQKEVDVQLAVDMLTHAFSKNMARATLIAGDLDFRPVVNSLVQLGTYVRLWYGKAHTADELRWSADEGHDLSVSELYRWTKNAYADGHPTIPNTEGLSEATLGYDLIKSGTLDGYPIRLFHRKDPSPAFYMVFDPADGPRFQVWHKDCDLLEKYVHLTEGTVWWNS
jgi:uncharacterized LabA/DUF88 family protein